MIKATAYPYKDPVGVFAALPAMCEAHFFFQDCYVASGKKMRRLLTLVAMPTQRLCVEKDGKTRLNDEQTTDDPFAILNSWCHADRPTDQAGKKTQIRIDEGPHAENTSGETIQPSFASGSVGYVAYLHAARQNDLFGGFMRKTPDYAPLRFGFFTACLLFDPEEGKCFLLHKQGKASEHLRAAWDKAPLDYAPQASKIDGLDFSQSDATFSRSIARIIDHIHEGDVFQVNLSRRVHITFKDEEGVFFSIASRLLHSGAGRFFSLHRYADCWIVSNSPERFFSIAKKGQKSIVACAPIKGTCRRHNHPIRDAFSRFSLRSSRKERAENVMIVDLLRNDLSHVCLPESIRVEKINEILVLGELYHLESTLYGTMEESLGYADLFKALFPCGSITGAPKESAMRLIETYETTPRNTYCGAIGYIDERGSADFSVAIRMASMQRNDGGPAICCYHSGSGITALSRPEKEIAENYTKMDAFFSTGLASDSHRR